MSDSPSTSASLTSSCVTIEIDPNAQHDWDKSKIHEVFSYQSVDLKQFIEKLLPEQGLYLARITVSVEVLQHSPIDPIQRQEAAEQAEREYFELVA